MSIIVNIKNKITQLDAGTFQNLCDAYLVKCGYGDIVSLGGEAGTSKTTKGTPDSYFVQKNGKYIFVEYTTQKTNLFNKIKSDIEKCIDEKKSHVKCEQIEKIIYCHTSSNLNANQDKQLKEMVKKVGIRLELIGLDKLAYNIYNRFPILARDFLEINLNTNQIHSYVEFINEYNSNKLVAPINTPFLFRKKEIKEIEDSLNNNNNVVILSGSAGTGKTRLALGCLERHLKNSNEKIFCIRSNGLSIYDDLKIYLDSPGEYLIFVDDANLLTDLNLIINYLNSVNKRYRIKILITVRDYALQKVINDIRNITSYKVVNINTFSDEEIKTILVKSLGIINEYYQKRIIKIAKGNARIAILAGRLVCKSNSLKSINDVTQLYENYYSTVLDDNNIFSNNTLIIIAGIISFLGKINLENINAISSILEINKIDQECFIYNVHILHNMEIIDIYNDKAVLFSDQCFSDFLLKYVFYDRKLISLSEIIKASFPLFKNSIIHSINTLCNIFINEDIYNFISGEIKTLWYYYKKADKVLFFEFVSIFFPFNPTDTLLILKNKIDSIQNVDYKLEDVDFRNISHYFDEKDDIIKILGGFANLDDFPTACDLFFIYYLKRPDLYKSFYYAIKNYFLINEKSLESNFNTQRIFFEKLIEYSNGGKEELINKLFLAIAKDFLNFNFSPIQYSEKNKMIICKISLRFSNGVLSYRKLIWEFLKTLCTNLKYKSKVEEILYSYGSIITKESYKVLQFDLKYIKSILDSYFQHKNLRNSLLANHFYSIIDEFNITSEIDFSKYFESNDYKMFLILNGSEFTNKLTYNDREIKKKANIKQFILNNDLKKIKKLIDVANQTFKIDSSKHFELERGLKYVFEEIIKQKKYFVELTKYYIEKDTPYNLNPRGIISSLFLFLPDSEIYELISTKEYGEKNTWMYEFFHELPKIMITKNYLLKLYDFLKDSTDKEIISLRYRDVEFIEKYNDIDQNALINGCKIILSKAKYSPFIVTIYFDLLFIKDPDEVLYKFNSEFKLFEDIYFFMLENSNNFDYNGKFLRAMYLQDASILDRYINYLFINNTVSSYDRSRISCFFILNDYLKIYTKIFASLSIPQYKYKFSSVAFLDSLLLGHDKENDMKRDEFIKESINLYCKDRLKMNYLFQSISKMSVEKKLEYILFFLKKNDLYEDFKSLPLFPDSFSYSGSIKNVYKNRIKYLNNLLINFNSIKFLEHKKYVEDLIDKYKSMIKNEEIREILDR